MSVCGIKRKTQSWKKSRRNALENSVEFLLWPKVVCHEFTLSRGARKVSGKIGSDEEKIKSGSSYRKDGEEKRKKLDEVVRKTQKIETYICSEPKRCQVSDERAYT